MRRNILPIRIISLVLAAVLLFQNAPLTMPSLAAELSDQEPTTDQPLTLEEEATLDEEETPEEEQIPEEEQTLTPEEQAAKTAFLEGIEKLRELLANETLKEDRVAFAQQLEEQLASLWQQLYGEPLYPEEENPDGAHEPTRMEALLEPQEFGEMDTLLHSARDTLNAAKKDLENGNPGEQEEKPEEEPAEEPEENSQGEVFHVVTVQEYLARLDALDAKMEDGSYKEDQEGFEKEFYALVELYCGEDEDVRETLMDEMLMLALEQGMNPADLMMVLSGSEDTEVPEEAAEPETGEETATPEETEETEQTDSPETNGETTAPEANDETAAPEETEETVTPENAATPAAETDPAATPAPAAETDAEAAPGEEAETDPAAIPAPMAEEDAEETPVQPAISGQLTDEENEHVKQVLLKALVLLVRLKTQPTGIYSASEVRGSGSYQVNESPNDFRFYTEYMTDATSAGITRLTVIHAYLKAGETVYLGSSVWNSCITANHVTTGRTPLGCDIVVETQNGNATTIKRIGANGTETSETGTRFTFDVIQNGAGYIGNHEQEMYGPRLPGDDEQGELYNKRYQPLVFQTTQDGIYDFHFHSQYGTKASINGGSCVGTPTVVTDSANWYKNYGAVAAWDITVVGSLSDDNRKTLEAQKKAELQKQNPNLTEEALSQQAAAEAAGYQEIKPGRAWTKFLALSTCGNQNDPSKASSLVTHVLTNDGYIYKVEMSELDPWGFIFFANNMGFTTTGQTPYSIYHSFYDNDNNLVNMEKEEEIAVWNPSQADTATHQTYKVFFNEPSQETIQALGALASNAEPSISNVSFQGIEIGVGQWGQGGYFSFTAQNVTSVTLEIDFRDMMRKMQAEAMKPVDERETPKGTDGEPLTGDQLAAWKSEQSAVIEKWKEYIKENGSGMISLSGSVTGKGTDTNSFYWDGRDTAGIMVPPGDFYKQGGAKIQIACKAKSGEIHFPMFDIENCYGGITIQRLHAPSGDTRTYDIYYNNNPLAYGTLRGAGITLVTEKKYTYGNDGKQTTSQANYYKLGKVYTYGKLKKSSFPTDDSRRVSTLVATDELDFAGKPIFEHQPVNSSTTKMTYTNSGGDMAGIDIWTYYERGTRTVDLSTNFTIKYVENSGTVTGRVFYDNKPTAGKTAYKASDGDRLLKDVAVRLMKKVTIQGVESYVPASQEIFLPLYNTETGMYELDDEGKIKYGFQEVDFETTTDQDGVYRISGVPYGDYYLQVELSQAATEVLHYFISVGKDGNTISAADPTKYAERGENGKIPFDPSRATSVKLNQETLQLGDIGFKSAIAQWKNLKVEKKWKEGVAANSDENSNASPVSSILVELWAWDSALAQSEADQGNNGRSGVLVDTQRLSKANGWSYTWDHLDRAIPYYLVEYYDKFSEDGTLMRDHDGNIRSVLIGNTMPLFDKLSDVEAGGKINPDSGSSIPDSDVDGETGGTVTPAPENTNPEKNVRDTYKYAFRYNDGREDTKWYYNFPHREDSVVAKFWNGYARDKVPVISFEDSQYPSNVYPDASWDREKIVNMDTNAMIFNMTFALSRDTVNHTDVVTLTNRQGYSEQHYFVWLNHETELQNFVSKKTHIDGQLPVVTPTALQTCEIVHSEQKKFPHVLGLTVTSLNPPSGEIKLGDSSDHFHLKNNGDTSVWFTPDDSVYTDEPTGTRTYMVQYTVKLGPNGEETPAPVFVDKGKLEIEQVDGNGNKTYIEVEGNPNYKTYTWTMSVYVYNLVPDGERLYQQDATEAIELQEALPKDTHLNWQWINNGGNATYVDTTEQFHDLGLISNDIVRVPLYNIQDYSTYASYAMGTCADLTGIALTTRNPETMSDEEFREMFRDIPKGQQVRNEDFVAVDTNMVTEDGGSYTLEGFYGDAKFTLTQNRAVKDGKVPKLDPGQDHTSYISIDYTPKTGENGLHHTEYLIYQVGVFSDDISFNGDYNELKSYQGTVMYSYVALVPMADDAKFAAASLSIGENFDLNFYVGGYKENLTDSSIADYYVIFEDQTGASRQKQEFDPKTNLTLKNQTLLVEGHEQTRDLYAFSYANKLTAYQMVHPITAKLYKKSEGTEDTLLDVRTYSIRQYAANMLAQKQFAPVTGNEKLYEMLIDMLNYGAAAQDYASASAWLQNSDYTKANDILETKFGGYDRYKSGTNAAAGEPELTGNGAGGITVNSAQVILEEGMKTSMKINFTLPEGSHEDLWDIRVTSALNEHLLTGGDWEKRSDGNVYLKKDAVTIHSDGNYSFTLHGISPFFWNQDITLEFIPLNVVSGAHPTLTISMAKYCNALVNAAEEPISAEDLGNSMIWYGNSAEQWFIHERKWGQRENDNYHREEHTDDVHENIHE